MIYGANGFTGQLIAREAVRRGHRPLLAGRSAERLAPIAEELGLDWIAIDLAHHDLLTAALADVAAVVHAAGPFVTTSAPMLRACIAAGTHYLDITGEIPALGHAFASLREARQRGVAVVPGCGFDVLPTDCLAAHVAARLPDATTLEMLVLPTTTPSVGTVVSALGLAELGGWVRQDGALRPLAFGRRARRQRINGVTRTIVPMPIGDLVTAWHTTRIPNITTYFAVPRGVPTLMLLFGGIGRRLVSTRLGRRITAALARRFAPGPDAATRSTGSAEAWVRVANDRGEYAEGWVRTADPYHFTAMAAVAALERVLAGIEAGTQSPAIAFGAEFVLTISGSEIHDGDTRATVPPPAA